MAFNILIRNKPQNATIVKFCHLLAIRRVLPAICICLGIKRFAKIISGPGEFPKYPGVQMKTTTWFENNWKRYRKARLGRTKAVTRGRMVVRPSRTRFLKKRVAISVQIRKQYLTGHSRNETTFKFLRWLYSLEGKTWLDCSKKNFPKSTESEKSLTLWH